MIDAVEVVPFGMLTSLIQAGAIERPTVVK